MCLASQNQSRAEGRAQALQWADLHQAAPASAPAVFAHISVTCASSLPSDGSFGNASPVPSPAPKRAEPSWQLFSTSPLQAAPSERAPVPTGTCGHSLKCDSSQPWQRTGSVRVENKGYRKSRRQKPQTEKRSLMEGGEG